MSPVDPHQRQFQEVENNETKTKSRGEEVVKQDSMTMKATGQETQRKILRFKMIRKTNMNIEMNNQPE
jgi:hypothetical protein